MGQVYIKKAKSQKLQVCPAIFYRDLVLYHDSDAASAAEVKNSFKNGHKPFLSHNNCDMLFVNCKLTH